MKKQTVPGRQIRRGLHGLICLQVTNLKTWVNTKKKLKISVNSLMHMNNMYASVIKKDIYIIIIIYRF